MMRAKGPVPGFIDFHSTHTHKHTMWSIWSKIASKRLMETSTQSSSQQEHLATIVFTQLRSYSTSQPSYFLCDQNMKGLYL